MSAGGGTPNLCEYSRLNAVRHTKIIKSAAGKETK